MGQMKLKKETEECAGNEILTNPTAGGVNLSFVNNWINGNVIQKEIGIGD
jgi:hypothetical protein